MERKYYLADVETVKDLIGYLEYRADTAEIDELNVIVPAISFTPDALRKIADIIKQSLKVL